MFSVPALSGQFGSLDDLLLCLSSLWDTFDVSSDVATLTTLRDQCLVLHHRFQEWQDGRVADLKPTTVRIAYERRGNEVAVGYWPGRIDTYFDLYVAEAWNISRAARLLLIALILRLSNILGEIHAHGELLRTAISMAEDMFASIPYHLVDNLQTFVSEMPLTTEITDPGRVLGGLLLMHPLYVVLNMAFLPEEMREYSRRSLLWIATSMGLGHAALLARVSWNSHLCPAARMQCL